MRIRGWCASGADAMRINTLDEDQVSIQNSHSLLLPSFLFLCTLPALPDHFDLTSLKLNVLLALPCQIKILDKCTLFDSFCNDCTYLIDQYPSLPPADAKLKHFYLFFSIAPVLWSLWSYKPLQGACIVVCEWNTSKYRLQNLQCRCRLQMAQCIGALTYGAVGALMHWYSSGITGLVYIDVWCSCTGLPA